MVLGVGGYFLQRQMGEETASLESTTAPAIHDINETERKLEDLRLFAKHGYLARAESKFAKEVLEIDAKEITDDEKESLFQITNRYLLLGKPAFSPMKRQPKGTKTGSHLHLIHPLARLPVWKTVAVWFFFICLGIFLLFWLFDEVLQPRLSFQKTRRGPWQVDKVDKPNRKDN